MRVLQEGDRNVHALLGKQRISDSRDLRPSRFVLGFQTPEGRFCLWNELTRRLLLLEGEEEAFFPSFEPLNAAEPPKVRPLPAHLAQSPAAAALYEQYFLLPRERQEARLYEEIVSALKLVAPKPAGLTAYTILSTTCCNARCAYCFEAGMEQIPMEPETADAIGEYIIRTRDADRDIQLVWFGGEPLLGKASIARIIHRLREKEVLFHSKLVTNGYLISDELIREMQEEWNLQSVQITLDGTEEKYNRIKNYLAPSGSPFRRVLNNVHALLNAGIRVNLRLNVARGGEEDIKRLIQQLSEEFAGEEKLNVYPYFIFITDRERRPYEVPPTEIIAYRQELAHIQEDLLERGLMDRAWPEKQDNKNLWKLPLSFCMAGSMESTAVMDPRGRLTNCEHCLPEDFYGDVWEGRSKKDVWDRLHQPVLDEVCSHCPFLPSCTTYMSYCPDVFKWCGWERRQILQKALQKKWAEYVAEGGEEATV